MESPIYVYDPARGFENASPVTMATIASIIQKLYDDGAVLFPKEVLQDIAQQLEEAQEGDIICVRGLDSVKVGFKTQTGASGNLATVPYLDYIPIRTLISFSHWLKNTGVAYCPIRFKHRMELDNEPGRLRPLDETRTKFDNVRREWEAHQICSWLETFLKSNPLPCKITKIVAFALGFMSKHSADVDDNLENHMYQSEHSADVDPYLHNDIYKSKRSAAVDGYLQHHMYQHALIVTLHKIISDIQQPHPLSCFAQDPEYTSVDKQLLQEFGITGLDDPHGFLKVDDETIVVSFCPDVPVRDIVADIARPAMMIWAPLGCDVPGFAHSDPDSPRLVKMLEEGYRVTQWEGSENDLRYFSSSCIYIRKA